MNSMIGFNCRVGCRDKYNSYHHLKQYKVKVWCLHILCSTRSPILSTVQEGCPHRLSRQDATNKCCSYWVSSFESQATILTRPTCSCISSNLNIASCKMKVHTLSQNLYVWRCPCKAHAHQNDLPCDPQRTLSYANYENPKSQQCESKLQRWHISTFCTYNSR